MPQQLDEEATKTVRRLLYENWVDTNAIGYDPTLDPEAESDALPIHFGNYNGDLPDPQISITQPQGEFTIGGRWSGKNMTTGEMNQFRRGTILVQCWAESGADYNGYAAKDVVHFLRNEVERIVNEHVEGPAAGEKNDDIWSFSSEWNGRFPDPMEDPATPTWQSQVTVTYDWERSQ